MLFSSVLVPIVAIQDSEILMFWSDFGITMYYIGENMIVLVTLRTQMSVLMFRGCKTRCLNYIWN